MDIFPLNNSNQFRSRTSSTSSSILNPRRSLVYRAFEFKFCEYCHKDIELGQYPEHFQNCLSDLDEKGLQHESPPIVSPDLDDEELPPQELPPIISTDLDEKGLQHESPPIVSTDLDEEELPPQELPPIISPGSISNVNDSSDELFSTPRVSPLTIIPNTKTCPVCETAVDGSEFMDHIEQCSTPVFDKITTTTTTTCDLFNEPIKECVICSKQIKTSELKEHVKFCLTKQTAICFACRRETDVDDRLHRKSSCPFEHIYCLPCLQRSMEIYVQNQLIPVCHPTLCTYQLSRYDILLIPLERRLSDQVLSLVQGQHEIKCPICSIAIEVDTDDTFYEHIDMCQLKNRLF